MPRTRPRSTAQITGCSMAAPPKGQWSETMRSPSPWDTWIGGSPKPEQLQRYVRPTNDTGLGIQNEEFKLQNAEAVRIPQQEAPIRRWYPVIDYSRCTNCMECIDFCLFGVYGIDGRETILVEQPDNCSKGCPACSRVCPENAIIFPRHKTPAIAGAEGEVAGKSRSTCRSSSGAPDTGETAEQAAIRERDEQLLLAGRAAVGAGVGLPPTPAARDKPEGELDALMVNNDQGLSLTCGNAFDRSARRSILGSA